MKENDKFDLVKNIMPREFDINALGINILGKLEPDSERYHIRTDGAENFEVWFSKNKLIIAHILREPSGLITTRAFNLDGKQI